MVAVAAYARLIVAGKEKDPLPHDKAAILALLLLSDVEFFLQDSIVTRMMSENKVVLFIGFVLINLFIVVALFQVLQVGGEDAFYQQLPYIF